ncbi:MAG: hypothetical protein LAO76_18635 [Acidobacteriia bacterium]|nr:hypothetical protein [Terriglobia bacterium]
MSENKEKNFPTFVWMANDNSQQLINLGQVRVIDEISKGHCRLVFSENYTHTLTGDGADSLVAQIVAHSVTIDGTPTAELWAKLGK